MIRKYQNHILQINLWHREEEPQNINRNKTTYHNHILQINSWYREEEPHNINRNKTSGKQFKQSNQLSLPCQDDYKTRNGYK